MRRRLIYIVSFIIISVVISGCAGIPNRAQNSAAASDTPSLSAVPVSESPDITVYGNADAYYLIFKDLFEKDSGLNGNITYLALDLSYVKSEDTDGIADLFETFCTNNDLTLLLDNYEGLTKKEYIKNMYFENGLLISFKDKSVSEIEIMTDAAKWRSGDGADGGTYTVTVKNETWEISDISGMWIS